uniref:Uncharacterized protein n=1 Tax=Arundo donax TaxID=35708 RepID=A0A0A9ATR1_ARUDO
MTFLSTSQFHVLDIFLLPDTQTLVGSIFRSHIFFRVLRK